MTEKKYSARDKFSQPLDAISIVSLAPGPRSSLSYLQIEEGRRRVAAGENIRDVVEEYVRANNTYTSS